MSRITLTRSGRGPAAAWVLRWGACYGYAQSQMWRPGAPPRPCSPPNLALPYYPSYFTDRFGKLCDQAGVPHIALHDAGHTHAPNPTAFDRFGRTLSTSCASGVDIKTMQGNMGHADPKFLTKVYIKAVGPAARAAAQTLEAVMLPKAA